MLPPSMQLSLVEVLPWEMFPIGITGKTLKRVFRERTEPYAVVEANRPVRLEHRDRTSGLRAQGERAKPEATAAERHPREQPW